VITSTFAADMELATQHQAQRSADGNDSVADSATNRTSNSNAQQAELFAGLETFMADFQQMQAQNSKAPPGGSAAYSRPNPKFKPQKQSNNSSSSAPASKLRGPQSPDSAMKKSGFSMISADESGDGRTAQEKLMIIQEMMTR
jgi:hypothetical protein